MLPLLLPYCSRTASYYTLLLHLPGYTSPASILTGSAGLGTRGAGSDNRDKTTLWALGYLVILEERVEVARVSGSSHY